MNESIVPGLTWRPSEGNAPNLDVPVHLEHTLPELRILHESLVVEGRVVAASTIGCAISAIEWMGEQLTTEIRRREALAECFVRLDRATERP